MDCQTLKTKAGNIQAKVDSKITEYYKERFYSVDSNGKTVMTVSYTHLISVAYDNNSASNGNYYNNKRTATVTITEHNFDTSRIAPVSYTHL